MTEMEKMGARAKSAASVLAVAGKKKKTALLAIADALVANKERIIDIKYFYQENKGKMAAINELVKKSTGDLILECDSEFLSF